MKKSLKKSGQRILRKFSRASIRASEESKEHIKENLLGRVSHIENIKLLILEWGLLAFALIMLAITQAFWFGDSYAENVFTSGGTYTEATIGNIGSMNPLFATTNSEKVLSKLLFATLATDDYSGHLGPGLAKYIRANENGKIWTVKLRDNLKWSDGEKITNEDVIFTAELIKNPAVTTIYDANLSGVKISENESGEIVFELANAYADFISALNFPLVPKHVLQDADPKILVEHSFSTAPITSGPFVLNAVQQNSAAEETVVYLASNPEFYKGGTMLSSFAIHTYKDKEAIVAALNAGSVTATAELHDVDAGKIDSGKFYQRNSSLNSGAFMFFNLNNAFVKDVAFRRAIRQGIDIAKIRAASADNLPLDFPLLSSQIALTKYPDLGVRDFDAAKAKIAEIAGGEEIHLNITTVNYNNLPEVARALAEELESLGVKAEVSVFDENQEFISNIVSRRNYDILIYEIELGSDPDLLPYYHSSQISKSGLNLSNYRNSLVDDLLLAARDTLDKELRTKKYESFLEYWVNDVPAIGLFRSNLTYFYNRNVRAYGDNLKLVTALDRFVDINNWAVNRGTKNETP
ncbi:hypothetical protein IKF34_00600 [Candidatus Saccharibacteria bacterium]|nr:hypothetical protein [Candidatus Saccharibacteria bacterium]